MTVTRRIRRRGEHAISRKTIARGMPVDPSEPVVTTLVCFVLFRTRGCGCSGHPAFPAPSVGRKFHAQLGPIAPRDRGRASFLGCLKNESGADPRHNGSSPRKAGTHNHRRLLEQKPLATVLKREGAAYGSPLLVRNCALGGDD